MAGWWGFNGEDKFLMIIDSRKWIINVDGGLLMVGCSSWVQIGGCDGE